MEDLVIHEIPSLRNPVLVTAFAGWPDAGEAGTHALRYLIHKLSARRCATLQPEKFYDFTRLRPHTLVNEKGERFLHWPTCEFFYGTSGDKDLVLFLAIEPHLKWLTFTDTVMSLADRCQVKMLVTLGAFLDAIPHSFPPRVSGRSNDTQWMKALDNLGVRFSSYQGPTSIHSTFYEACQQRSLPWVTLWGHVPHYVEVAPSPKISHALLTTLSKLLGLPIDLEELRVASAEFDHALEEALAKNPELTAYVKQLEDHYTESSAGAGEGGAISEPLMKELEGFLRREREKRNKGNSPEGDGPS
ncbi:MAG: PAC2 family protein [Chloroflexota bacterium]|nr:PAC2 family protein [Chloroflexota bacterium]